MPNLAHVLEQRARELPDCIGLHFEDGRRWTFGELDALAAATAHALAEHGVGVGSRVGSYLVNGPELVVLLFASWKLGAVPVTMSSLYNADELAGSVAKTAANLLVTDDRGLTAALTVRKAVPVLHVGGSSPRDVPSLEEARVGHEGAIETVERGVDDDAVILFTGGTTGEPKAVTMTHGGVQGALAQLARASKGGKTGPYEMTPESVSPNLVALPLFHSGGQHSFLFAWYVGRSVVLMERFRAAEVARLVQEHNIDNLFLMPTMLYDLVGHEPSLDLSPVRSVLVSGQALDPTLRARFERRFDVPILSNYGATELGHVAGWTARDLREGRWKPGAAGRIYDGVEIEIRDEDGRVLPTCEPGEICVRTSITRGYVDEEGDGGGAQALIENGWVHSGDIGFIDEDRVLFLVGRARDMIKCGGFQVWPSELEQVLNEHPGVADVAVVAAPHARLGEIPRAYVVRADDDRPDEVLAEELIATTRDRLAHFKAVREVTFVDELPRSEAGKIRRGELVGMS